MEIKSTSGVPDLKPPPPNNTNFDKALRSREGMDIYFWAKTNLKDFSRNYYAMVKWV